MPNNTRKGHIDAHSVYPLQTFMLRLGIGRHSLTALRRRGLPVRRIGTRAFVDGKEALETLRRVWGEEGEQPE